MYSASFKAWKITKNSIHICLFKNTISYKISDQLESALSLVTFGQGNGPFWKCGNSAGFTLGCEETFFYLWLHHLPWLITSTLSSTSMPPSWSSSISLWMCWRASKLKRSASVIHGGLIWRHGSVIKRWQEFSNTLTRSTSLSLSGIFIFYYWNETPKLGLL